MILSRRAFLNAQGFFQALFAMFAVISSAVKIVCSSAISASVEMEFRDFLLSGEEVESSELVDILFLLFSGSSVMNSAIFRYGELGYQKKLRTIAPISVFTPPLLVPVPVVCVVGIAGVVSVVAVVGVVAVISVVGVVCVTGVFSVPSCCS